MDDLPQLVTMFDAIGLSEGFGSGSSHGPRTYARNAKCNIVSDRKCGRYAMSAMDIV